MTSATSVAGRDSMMVMQSALLTGAENGELQPALAGPQATDRAQGKPCMNPRGNTALLRLQLDYE